MTANATTNASPPATQLLTAAEWAAARRISMTTAYRHLRAGLVPGVERTAGDKGDYRIRVKA